MPPRRTEKIAFRIFRDGRTTARSRLRHQRRDDRPFRIRQVGFVAQVGTAMLPASGRGPHGTSRSGFSTLLESPPSRPLNPCQTLSDGLLASRRSKHQFSFEGRLLIAIAGAGVGFLAWLQRPNSQDTLPVLFHEITLFARDMNEVAVSM
jgi:hypothetical protein